MARLTTIPALVATIAPPLLSGPARAQQNPGYFVPSQPAAPSRPRVERAPAPRQSPITQQPLPPPPSVEIPGGLANSGAAAEPEPPVAQLPQQPVPDLPALPRGTTPPAAVIGVLGVPEIMHGVIAAQQVEKVIGERREKLNQDAQREQAAWRDLQAQLSAQRATLNPDQIRAKERELQERITTAQKSFRDRNRIIQEAAQYALGQIERNLIGVIRQVSESHGMNLVLHRQQVALNINEFDITNQVIDQMNKILPSVTIPPDGVSPVAQAQADVAAATKPAAGSAAPQAPLTTSASPAPPPARR